MRVPYDPKDPRLASASRTTRWRARKRGWWCPGYRTREVCPAPQLSEQDAKRIISLARKAAMAAIRQFGCDTLSPFEPSDVVGEAILRLIELAGHPKFSHDGFCFVAALNAARKFIKTEVFTPARYVKNSEEFF